MMSQFNRSLPLQLAFISINKVTQTVMDYFLITEKTSLELKTRSS